MRLQGLEQALQTVVDLLGFGFVESIQDTLTTRLVAAGGFVGPAIAGSGELDEHAASIVGVGLARYQPGPLQPVDELRHGTGGAEDLFREHRRREMALGGALEQAQDGVLGEGETVLAQALALERLS